MTKIKVEKNVATEVEVVKRGQKQVYPLDTMEVNDSFTLGKYRRKKSKSVYGSIYHYTRKEGNEGKEFKIGKEKGTDILRIKRVK